MTRETEVQATANVLSLYQNNLKNREFGKEALQNVCSEQVTLAARQGTSENENSEEKATTPKTDSSGCFGINGRG